jgi:FtsP/CotA-like multicopper oxidase with cupredoxin domain
MGINISPQPTIEANWGDWIQVTLHNQIANPVEGTAFHWHGILQKDAPWMDGKFILCFTEFDILLTRH